MEWLICYYIAQSSQRKTLDLVSDRRLFGSNSLVVKYQTLKLDNVGFDSTNATRYLKIMGIGY